MKAGLSVTCSRATTHYLVDELLTDEHKLMPRHRPQARQRPPEADHRGRLREGRSSIGDRPRAGGDGAFGPIIPQEYGGMGLDQISYYGLIMQEIERCDSGLRSLCSVQGSLGVYPITEVRRRAEEEVAARHGPREEDRLLRPHRPTTGNPGGMVTVFQDKGDHYLLNGAKMWISNSPLADVAVVWAKAENTEGRIHGLLVERVALRAPRPPPPTAS